MSKINKSFEVIFENDNFLAINKPNNLSTQKNKFYENSVENVLEKFGEPFSLLNRCGIVHRIDMNTTGVLLIAKNFHYQKFLSELFKDRKIEKHYISLNIGKIAAKSGVIKFYLKKIFSKDNKIRMGFGSYSDKLVEIKFEKLSENEKFTLFDVNSITGRTHQIRLAFKSIKIPIYNDSLYKETNHLENIFTSEGQYLHSYSVEFFDGKEKFKIVANLPDFFKKKISDEGLKF